MVMYHRHYAVIYHRNECYQLVFRVINALSTKSSLHANTIKENKVEQFLSVSIIYIFLWNELRLVGWLAGWLAG